MDEPARPAGPKYPKIFPGALRAPDCFTSYVFTAFGLQIPQIFSWRASRAGLLDFPMFLQLLDSKYPNFFPGALRAPDCLISLCFYSFWTPNTPNFSRRASRAGPWPATAARENGGGLTSFCKTQNLSSKNGGGD